MKYYNTSNIVSLEKTKESDDTVVEEHVSEFPKWLKWLDKPEGYYSYHCGVLIGFSKERPLSIYYVKTTFLNGEIVIQSFSMEHYADRRFNLLLSKMGKNENILWK